ncbi:MAG TPA: hypothetical protein VM925_09195, partial [Labilithrix sp.]|nr:hypothetical protein [Labilithrix sp.]
DYPKAHSFMGTLFEMDPDPEMFKRLYRRMRVDWRLDAGRPERGARESERLFLLDDRIPLSGPRLEAVLDDALKAAYGFDLATFRARWLTAVEKAIAEPPSSITDEDRLEIVRLLALRDTALARGDALLYRALSEGFYCQNRSDAMRARVAERMTAHPAPGKSTLVQLADLGLKNYPHVLVIFDRTSNGITRRVIARVEHFPVGWRFIGASDEEKG